MEQAILEFLFKQLPVIIVLGALCFFMYKYFTKVIEKMQKEFSESLAEKDILIREKDGKIEALTQRLFDVTSKNNEVIGKLRELIEKMLTAPKL